MSQKIAKRWSLSVLATKLLFRQIYCHHQHFTSADGFWNDFLGLIASDVERPNDLAAVSIASASLLKTASIKSNDLTLKLPRVVSFLIFYILGSKKCILSDYHDSVVVILLIFWFLAGICCWDRISAFESSWHLDFDGLTIKRGTRNWTRTFQPLTLR